MPEMTKAQLLKLIEELEKKIDELKSFINTQGHTMTKLQSIIDTAKKVLG